MSSVVISGDTSGTVTLSAPAVAGTTTITLPAATGTMFTTADVATQANQETATSTTTLVTPGRQQYHPSSAKVWIMFNGTGTVSNLASYNVTSLTDNASGDYTVTYITNFSSANYGAALINSIYNDSLGRAILAGLRDSGNPTASSIRIQTLDVGVTSNPDCQRVGLVCFGDQ